MKKNAIIAISLAALLCSCVSQSEHDKIVYEKDALVQERDKLKQELEDIKFGAPNLLSDGKQFYAAKDFLQARQKFQTLIDKHPDMSQSAEARAYLLTIDEEQLWSNASTSEDVSFTESYISKYPNGKYIGKATSRRNELRLLNIQKAYSIAVDQNTSKGWKKFLEEYPDHVEAANIRKKIIRLEVNEISSNSQTGQIPSFDQYNSGYSSNSSVAITNNTGCELTVRYSGPDAEIIIIPSGDTKKVFLPSGSYKIAASACGENYAGVENLHGQYSSTFYITTSKY